MSSVYQVYVKDWAQQHTPITTRGKAGKLPGAHQTASLGELVRSRSSGDPVSKIKQPLRNIPNLCPALASLHICTCIGAHTYSSQHDPTLRIACGLSEKCTLQSHVFDTWSLVVGAVWRDYGTFGMRCLCEVHYWGVGGGEAWSFIAWVRFLFSLSNFLCVVKCIFAFWLPDWFHVPAAMSALYPMEMKFSPLILSSMSLYHSHRKTANTYSFHR